MTTDLRVTGLIERKYPKLPRFLVVPIDVVASLGLERTTVVEGMLNGVEIGRRTIKPWDERRWFIELPEPLCRRAGVDTGDSVTLTFRIAADDLPAELSQLITSDRNAKAASERLSISQQRMLREHIASAKQPGTRQRRAARALCR